MSPMGAYRERARGGEIVIDGDGAPSAVTFWCAGIPQPQGSKSFKGFTPKGHAVMAESAKHLDSWRVAVGWAGRAAMRRQPRLAGPLLVRLEFVLRRPVSLPKTRPTPPAVKKPDVDKLVRAVLDALTNVVFDDDSQVVDVHATKRLAEVGETPGVHVRITKGCTP